MMYKSSIFTLFGNELCISRDFLTGRRNISLIKHIESSELLPNSQYPVHSYYKGADGYELKFGERIVLHEKDENGFWMINKVEDNAELYVISDQDLKNVLLKIGYEYSL